MVPMGAFLKVFLYDPANPLDSEQTLYSNAPERVLDDMFSTSHSFYRLKHLFLNILEFISINHYHVIAYMTVIVIFKKLFIFAIILHKIQCIFDCSLGRLHDSTVPDTCPFSELSRTSVILRGFLYPARRVISLYT